MTIRACRVCGCTENRACVTDGTACSWAEHDLCSACVETPRAKDAELAQDLGWGRLAHTNYLVIPRLALLSMPDWWQADLERLLRAADKAGLETPEYVVLRDDGRGGEFTRARVVNQETGFVRVTKGKADPWADYKYGDIGKLCPGFVGLDAVAPSVQQ